MNSATPSQDTQGTFVAELGPSTSSTHTSRYIPGGKIIDCCTLCDYGIITVTCGICFRETHKKCAEAFLRGTDKKIDVNLDCWRCPRCLTMVHLGDPSSCEEKKEKKNKRNSTNQKKRWCKC
ncbi:uncharacterized protein LOC123317527 [Coccinella septempunctata]|uniref:uncharacterized protein LOC123317527 n=1 Tax=Coccinella septempunctata TaxID=41139 RepID=UPI001D08601F|nr:uncharacterized protein LOC123317527 [Coccinella septempunctata]